MILSLLMTFIATVQAAPVIRDFKTQIYHGDAAHPQLWAIEIAPPAGHHFNLEAPKSAQQEKFALDVIQESPERILFQSEKWVKAGAVIEVIAFVCDEKKTYCLKKKMFVTLDDSKAKVITEKFSKKAEAKVANIPVPVKETELFIDNDPAKAIAEARTTKKPVLIDFYGIWCPPCNLYNEMIFNTKEFAEQAKRFVLLKMDADHEKSFELKSKFKIGGYPTLIIATVNDRGALEESERIVGYYPAKEFYTRLNAAYQHRNDPAEQRWKGRLEELLSRELEQKNYDSMLQLTEGVKEPKLLLYRFVAQTKKSADFLKDSKNLESIQSTLREISKTMAQQSSDTLIRAVDFLSDEFWVKQAEFLAMADRFLDLLSQRIDPNTMFVRGSELTQPDLDSMRVDLYETKGDEKTAFDLKVKAASDYEKLIQFFANQGKKDLRSLNLEYAYWLWNTKRVDEAKKIYAQFLKKYPKEFTFNYAASKMYLSLKELDQARSLAEKAFEHSYGDNRIRAMDRLVTIMAEQGKKADAILRGNEFLKQVKVPQGLTVRTGRYVDALKKTIEKVGSPAVVKE